MGTSDGVSRWISKQMEEGKDGEGRKEEKRDEAVEELR